MRVGRLAKVVGLAWTCGCGGGPAPASGQREGASADERAAASAKGRDPEPAAASTKDANAETSAVAEAPERCGVEVGRALEAELLSYCDWNVRRVEPDVPAPPPGAETRASVSSALVPIHVTATEILVSEAELGTRPLTDALRDALTHAAVPAGESAWMLSAARGAPLERVRAVMQALVELERPRGVLVFSIPAQPRPAPRDAQRWAALDDKLTAAPRDEAATIVAAAIDEAIPAACPGYRTAFARLAHEPVEQRCVAMARSLTKATLTCDCPDANALWTLIHAMTVRSRQPDRMATFVDVTLDATATPAARLAGTWSEAIDVLTPHLTALWL